MSSKLEFELETFKDLWQGGFFEGDPLNPIGKSTYGQLGFVSVLHATYLRCIKPYIKSHTVALEIGPGRGAWTRALLPSKEVYVLDALSEQHNRFYQYLGNPSHVRYFQVTDFKCDFLPNDSFTYMFSFGCLCHVSFGGISEYAKNLYPKLKSGCQCFWMIADYAKYNYAVSHQRDLSIWRGVMPTRRRYRILQPLFTYLMRMTKVVGIDPDSSDDPRPGRWYDSGIERTCTMLKATGYEIIDPDVGTCLRDPIVHFTKP